VAKEKTREEKLHAAAVLRRSFELQEGRYQEGFRFVYQGVLRDLGLAEAEVEEYLAAHRDEVEQSIGRRGQTE
jgi:hypothetical protein